MKKFTSFIKKYNQFITESRKDKILSLINNLEIGDIIEESYVYQYIEQIHNNEVDITDGNLSNRIEHYTEYKLTIVNIKDINIDEFYIDDELVDEYIYKYEETNSYPPVVLAHDLRIIDGTHRLNALYNHGIFTAKALVGQGNESIYDEFEEFNESNNLEIEELGVSKDVIYINLKNGKEHIGIIVLEFLPSKYSEFEDIIDEYKYNKIFTNDTYVKIDKIEIKPKYRNNGYAKKLMLEAIKYVEKRNVTKVIYLNAQPYDDLTPGMELSGLVDFYKSFGFEIFIDDYKENKEMILTLETVRSMYQTQRTIDVFVKQFADEYIDKQKSKYKEPVDRDDIIVDEFDEETPIYKNDKKILEPTSKINSIGDGATNMP